MDNKDKLELPTQSKKETIFSFSGLLDAGLFFGIGLFIFGALTFLLLKFDPSANNTGWAFLGFAIYPIFKRYRHSRISGVKEDYNSSLKTITEFVTRIFHLGMILIIAGLIFWGGWWFLSSISNGLGSIGKYEGQTAEEWFNEYDAAYARIYQLNRKIEDFQYALQDANNNIEEANSNINSAKSYEGASYDDMVDALNSLDTVSTVDEP